MTVNMKNALKLAKRSLVMAAVSALIYIFALLLANAAEMIVVTIIGGIPRMISYLAYIMIPIFGALISVPIDIVVGIADIFVLGTISLAVIAATVVALVFAIKGISASTAAIRAISEEARSAKALSGIGGTDSLLECAEHIRSVASTGKKTCVLLTIGITLLTAVQVLIFVIGKILAPIIGIALIILSGVIFSA